MKNRVALYLRVSGQKQLDGYSIGEQEERLRQFCFSKDWTVVKVYTDPAFSGSNLNRPAITQLITDCKKNIFDIVFVYKLDRLSRSQKDVLYLIEDVFNKNNIGFISLTESFDTTSPYGKAMIGMLSVFAQLERENIKERMTLGRDGRAKKGLWRAGSNVPLGYEYIDGHLIVNEAEAVQIREMYDFFNQGNSVNATCKHLHELYTNRYSSWADSSYLGSMLRNPLYTGKLRYKGEIIEAEHEGIVPFEVWQYAQDRLEKIRKDNEKRITNRRGSSLLTGLLWCGNCGARYFTTTAHSGEYKYYKCYTRDGNSNMKKGDYCKNPNFRMSVLDDMILSEIEKLQTYDGYIEEIIEERMKSKDTGEYKRLKAAEKKIEKQIERLVSLYSVGKIDVEIITKQIETLNAEKSNILAEISRLNVKSNNLSIDDIKAEIKTFSDIKNISKEEQRSIIQSLINKIVIFEDHIEIHWTFT